MAKRRARINQDLFADTTQEEPEEEEAPAEQESAPSVASQGEQEAKETPRERAARQAHYDLPAGMKDEVAALAEAHGTTASQIASFLLAEGIKKLRSGELDLEPYKEPSPSIRYKYTLRIEFPE